MDSVEDCRHRLASGEHLAVGSIRTAATINQRLGETRVGQDEEACQKQKRCRWNEAQKSKAREGAGITQLACGLDVGWGFGRGVRDLERGSQSAFWEDRPLGLDGRLGAHPIFSRRHLSSPALGVMAGA